MSLRFLCNNRLIGGFVSKSKAGTALDYDGDGATELAVWRPSTAGWWVMKPDGYGLVLDYRFGLSTDKPLGYNSAVSFLLF